MRNKILFFTCIVFLSVFSRAQNEPYLEQIKTTIQKDAFTVNVLLQSGFRYSLQNDNFQGGRTFEASNARLSVKGILDNKFFYRIHLNFVREPNLLDAYLGVNFLRIGLKPILLTGQKLQVYLFKQEKLGYLQREMQAVSIILRVFLMAIKI